LEYFASVFPSREVLSAAGVAYHKEALRYAPASEFQHLLVLDASTRAPRTKGGDVHPTFRRLMDKAMNYYGLAVNADPAYAPAQNNLGAGYLDLGDRELARGHISRALREDAGFAAAYNNRAILFALDKEPTRAEQD